VPFALIGGVLVTLLEMIADLGAGTVAARQVHESVTAFADGQHAGPSWPLQSATAGTQALARIEASL
jgi:hypothetical protein